MKINPPQKLIQSFNFKHKILTLFRSLGQKSSSATKKSQTTKTIHDPRIFFFSIQFMKTRHEFPISFLSFLKYNDAFVTYLIKATLMPR